MVSALLGSDWFENEIVAGLPSSTGPSFARSAVGATLLTWAVKVLMSVPPFGSVTVTVTV